MLATITEPLTDIISSFEPPKLECFQRQYGHLKIKTRSYGGIKPIEIDKVIGTVGRCQRDEDFNELIKTERYKRIKQAVDNQEQMPAIEVYQVNEEYYIVDGHHRVIASKEIGRKFIDAKITEYKFGEPKNERYHGCLKSDYRSCDLDKELDNKTKLIRELEKLETVIKNINNKLPYRQIITAWYDTELLPWFNENDLKKLIERDKEQQ